MNVSESLDHVLHRAARDEKVVDALLGAVLLVGELDDPDPGASRPEVLGQGPERPLDLKLALRVGVEGHEDFAPDEPDLVPVREGKAVPLPGPDPQERQRHTHRG